MQVDDSSQSYSVFRRSPNTIAASVIMIVHAALVLGGTRANFLTTDETKHLQSGVYYLQTFHFDNYRVNPPVMKFLAAIPVIIVRPHTDYRTLVADNLPASFDAVRIARICGIFWSLIGAWAIYRWGHEVYGGGAGCLGIVLWCFDPNILAHASLATPDIPATVMGLLATFGFVSYLRAPSWGTACLAGILLGVAQLTKFTLLSLYGIWPAMWFIWWRGGGPRIVLAPCRWIQILQASLLVAISIWVINLGYGFQGTGRFLNEHAFASKTLGDAKALIGRWFGDVMVPLPLDYIAGIDEQQAGFELGQPSYLAGRWRDHGGWWYYYLFALSVKEPLGGLALVAWNIASIFSRRTIRGRWRDEAMLWLPAVAILLAVSSQTGFSKHVRYALPALPFVFISTGKLAVHLRRGSRFRGALVSALLLWAVSGSLSVYPHSLSYFNEAAGGPLHGHDYLLDSNIDWGQDLLELKRWFDLHPEAKPLGLAVYSIVDPRHVGLVFSLPPPGPTQLSAGDSEIPAMMGPVPGYYAVSVNYLRGKLFPAPDGRGGRVQINRRDYFSYFRHFRPLAYAGYSIYIYKITPQEANLVRGRLGLPSLADHTPAADARSGEHSFMQ